MNRQLLISLLAIIFYLAGSNLPAGERSVSVAEDGLITSNGISFRFDPVVQIRHADDSIQNLDFDTSTQLMGDRRQIFYTHPLLRLSIDFSAAADLCLAADQVAIKIEYLAAADLQTLALRLDWERPEQLTSYQGTAAILQQDIAQNQDLCPYRDKLVQYKSPGQAFWIAGSLYQGCTGIERMDADLLYLYDYRLHYAKFYSKQKRRFIEWADTKPVKAGEIDTAGFIIFSQQPPIVKLNRWRGENRAALAISNDADGGNNSRLRAVFWGSTDQNSPKYLQQGLLANKIKVSNTVFGSDIDDSSALWAELLESDIAIGYHTYSKLGDSTHELSQNLLTDMAPYNVRLWIDHAWQNNPEDFCRSGSDSSSRYYLLNVINQSQIDYAWMGALPAENEFNAFDNPWRLPHRLYTFTELTRPVWFFGRTRLEAYKYLDEYHEMDWESNITAANLDRLLSEEGLSLIYTHFFFGSTAHREAFFRILPNGQHEVTNIANASFALLNTYQTQRGLWIDTVENIFDRMLATEQVLITKFEQISARGKIAVTLQNTSGYTLDNLVLWIDGTKRNINDLPAGAEIILVTSEPDKVAASPDAQNYSVQYVQPEIYLKSLDHSAIAALKIKLYNLKGQCLQTYQTPPSRDLLRLPAEGLASGIYLLRIADEKGQKQTLRFVVVK